MSKHQPSGAWNTIKTVQICLETIIVIINPLKRCLCSGKRLYILIKHQSIKKCQPQTAAKQFLIGLLKSSLSLFSKFPLLPRKKCQLLRYCVDKPKHGKFNFRIDKRSQHEGWSRFGKETKLQPMQLLNRQGRQPEKSQADSQR